jgi:hypothetical protein
MPSDEQYDEYLTIELDSSRRDEFTPWFKRTRMSYDERRIIQDKIIKLFEEMYEQRK